MWVIGGDNGSPSLTTGYSGEIWSIWLPKCSFTLHRTIIYTSKCYVYSFTQGSEYLNILLPGLKMELKSNSHFVIRSVYIKNKQTKTDKLRCLITINTFALIPFGFGSLQATFSTLKVNTVKKIKSGGRKCVNLCQLCIATVNAMWYFQHPLEQHRFCCWQCDYSFLWEKNRSFSLC